MTTSLHWVLKIGNLKRSLSFFESILGLRVLRHEEFDQGCAATCNGPYGGAWSKTMIGYVPESLGFALELTYNYGIDSYQFGNDLLYIALHQPSALERAEKLGYQVSGNTILGPDNYNYKILPWVGGRSEQFAAIALRVANISNAKDYWCNVLGLKEFSAIVGLESEYPTCFLGLAANQTVLQLIEVHDGHPVDHALSSGRVAFACKSVQPIFEVVSAKGDKVLVPPLTLPTPGKADVVVTILLDRDGYEICFVEDEAFYQLAEPKYDIVDFAFRASKGGDGNPLPKFTKEVHGEGHALRDVQSLQDLLQQLKGQQGNDLVVLCFTAAWCKKCKLLHPCLETLAREREGMGKFFFVDIDESEELASSFQVSLVPHFVAISVEELQKTPLSVRNSLTGSDEKALKAFLDQLFPSL